MEVVSLGYDDVRTCFIVYANVSDALAASRKNSMGPNVYGEFVQVEPYSIPLIKYAQLVSEALRGKFLHRSVKYLKG
jgi:hypothetical protein